MENNDTLNVKIRSEIRKLYQIWAISTKEVKVVPKRNRRYDVCSLWTYNDYINIALLFKIRENVGHYKSQKGIKFSLTLFKIDVTKNNEHPRAP